MSNAPTHAPAAPISPAASRSETLRNVASAVVLGGTFVTFAWASWRTWPDILVDFGQELYVPWRLSEGEVLYRDVAWVTGPLSQYVNATLFRLFGVSLSTLIAANLVVLAAIVGMLWFLLRRCGTRATATSTVLFYLAVFAFSQYSLIGNYNAICPYRHDMTHGLALGLLCVLFLVQHGRTNRRRWLAGAGTCLGLLTLSKIELTLAAGLTIAAALPLFARRRMRAAGDVGVPPPATSTGGNWLVQTVRSAGVVAAAASVPIVVAVAALAGSLGWSEALRHTFRQFQLALSPQFSTATGFYRAVAGTDDVFGNLVTMAFETVLVLAAVVVAYVAERLFGEMKRAKLVAIVLGMVASFCGLRFVLRSDWADTALALPILTIPIVLISLRSACNSRSGDSPETVLFLLAVFGAGLLPKILLRVGWGHYGFILAAPATLVVVHVVLHVLPRLLARPGGSACCFRAVMGGLLAACAASQVIGWVRIDQWKTATIGEGSDRFYVDPRNDNRVVPTLRTLSYLRNNVQPGDTLIVFPNGVMLNYLLRAQNPTQFVMFSPWESDVHGGEDRIADAVIDAAPDYAVLLTMDLTIHGRGNFGEPGFGGRILKFLQERYDVVDVQGANGGFGGPFVATTYKRRGPR